MTTQAIGLSATYTIPISKPKPCYNRHIRNFNSEEFISIYLDQFLNLSSFCDLLGG